MAALNVQTLSLSGTAMTANSAAAGGDTFVNNGRTYYKAINGDASPTTITFVTTGTQTSAGLAVADLAVVVAAGADEIIGPFPTSTFGQNVSVTYSSVTSLTADVFKLAD